MKAVLITSSLLILVLIVLRYLLRGRISPRLQYALWLLVAVRLLVPLSLPGTALSVLNVFSPEASDTTVYVSSHGLSTSAPAPETGTLGDGREMEIYTMTATGSPISTQWERLRRRKQTTPLSRRNRSSI